MDTAWSLNYASKTRVVASKTSGSISIRMRGLERTLVRGPIGHETLLAQTIVGTMDAFVSEIPPAFLVGEEICSQYIANVLSKQNICSWTLSRITPNICKDVINMRRRLGEEEEKGFLVEAEVEIVEERWSKLFSDDYDSVDGFSDDYDSVEGRRTPIEHDCVICLEESKFPWLRTIMKLPCSHSFHTSCILAWLRRKSLCPTCSKVI